MKYLPSAEWCEIQEGRDFFKSVGDLVNKLSMLFSNKVKGVVFSSVHKAKGLEAKNIFILRPELMPHPKAEAEWELEQEDNCLYVAVTRTKNRLIFVKTEEKK